MRKINNSLFNQTHITVKKIAAGLICSHLALFSVFLISCSKNENLSMEQRYIRDGRPVQTRIIQTEKFTQEIKFPAEYKASSESTAYAKIPDVVRSVHVTVGDKVRRDEVIVSLSEDNANYQQAKLQVQNAENSFGRMELLFQENGVSKQDYDNARTQLNVAKESLRLVEEMIHIKSPISGTVTQINIQKSSNVAQGTPLFTVSNQDSYEAHFYVLANEISDIRTNEKAVIITESETLNGRVTEVSMTMDSMRRAFGAKATFEGQAKSITSGMNVDVAVESYSNSKAVVVSQKELVTENGKNYVFVVPPLRSDSGQASSTGADLSAKKVEIKLGRQNGLKFEVLEGLKDGDQLITDGVQYLNDGDKICIL